MVNYSINNKQNCLIKHLLTPQVWGYALYETAAYSLGVQKLSQTSFVFSNQPRRSRLGIDTTRIHSSQERNHNTHNKNVTVTEAVNLLPRICLRTKSLTHQESGGSESCLWCLWIHWVSTMSTLTPPSSLFHHIIQCYNSVQSPKSLQLQIIQEEAFLVSWVFQRRRLFLKMEKSLSYQ